METIIEVLIGSLLSAAITYVKTVRKDDKELEDKLQVLCAGVQALLRNKMRELNEVYQVVGWCTVEQKDNFNNLYEQYHRLGSNGVMTHIKDEILAMPTEAPVKEDEANDENTSGN